MKQSSRPQPLKICWPGSPAAPGLSGLSMVAAMLWALSMQPPFCPSSPEIGRGGDDRHRRRTIRPPASRSRSRGLAARIGFRRPVLGPKHGGAVGRALSIYLVLPIAPAVDFLQHHGHGVGQTRIPSHCAVFRLAHAWPAGDFAVGALADHAGSNRRGRPTGRRSIVSPVRRRHPALCADRRVLASEHEHAGAGPIGGADVGRSGFRLGCAGLPKAAAAWSDRSGARSHDRRCRPSPTLFRYCCCSAWVRWSG